MATLRSRLLDKFSAVCATTQAWLAPLVPYIAKAFHYGFIPFVVFQGIMTQPCMHHYAHGSHTVRLPHGLCYYRIIMMAMHAFKMQCGSRGGSYAMRVAKAGRTQCGSRGGSYAMRVVRSYAGRIQSESESESSSDGAMK